MWCDGLVFRLYLCDGLSDSFYVMWWTLSCVIYIDAIVEIDNYIFVVITACNDPCIYIYICCICIEKQRKKKQKKIGHFAECLSQNTRQSGLHRLAAPPVWRVLKYWHSAKIWKFAECQDPALGKVATWRVSARPRTRCDGTAKLKL